jgi:mono/diheme cytochrome c family protein
MGFATLYQQNCAGCHGDKGKSGAAISLDNPVYLAVAGEANVRQVTAKGVAGTLMPAFCKIRGRHAYRSADR